MLEANREEPLIQRSFKDRIMAGEGIEVVIDVRIIREDDDTDARVAEAHDGVHALHERRVRVGVHVDACADAVLAAAHGLTEDIDVLDIALCMCEDLVQLHGGIRDDRVGVQIHPGDLLDCHACRVAHRGVAVNTDALDRDGLGECGLYHCHTEGERDE